MRGDPINFFGHMTRDPESQTTRTGSDMVKFAVAANHSIWDSAEEKYVDKAIFYDCTAFGPVAKQINENLGKGDYGWFRGPVQFREYSRRDGSPGYSHDVTVEDAHVNIGLVKRDKKKDDRDSDRDNRSRDRDRERDNRDSESESDDRSRDRKPEHERPRAASRDDRDETAAETGTTGTTEKPGTTADAATIATMTAEPPAATTGMTADGATTGIAETTPGVTGHHHPRRKRTTSRSSEQSNRGSAPALPQQQ